ncbi:Zn(II)2Cys6 transcription factor [Aspergillus stella-maris]|uniref:Zn(II)2Cys6 transcription factor n=1 Tax=Aspergillus stella-maris TaxID=1810926 RepID=UPI003CCD60EE
MCVSAENIARQQGRTNRERTSHNSAGDAMTGSSKDHTGCWTCRLRRKKCDLAQPICGNCLALGIKCYTDQHKPEWMDNGSKQREMAQRFKVDVKRSAARRRSRRLMQRLAWDFDKEGEVQTLGSCTAEESNGLETQRRRSASPENTPAYTAEVRAPSEVATATGSTQISLDRSTTPGLHRFSQPIDNELEMQFVMIYLDYTFPILFPLYTPSLTEGGRGWLLVLPMKVKALYHTIISLTSYFFSSTPLGSGPAQEVCSSLAFDEQRKQIDLAVQMVSRDLEVINNQGVQSNLVESVYLLESIVQLLIFDGVVGTTGNWRIHLDAAIVLFEQIIQPPGSLCSILDAMRQRSGLPANSSGDTFWTADQAAFRFYPAILLFADIIASTALEQPPKLQGYHANLLGDTPGPGKASLQLEGFIGCQNEVLCSIGRISALDGLKKDMKKDRRLNMAQLMERASAIERDLTTAITSLRSTPNTNNHSGFPFSPRQSNLPTTPPLTLSHNNPMDTTTKTITLVWAHSARIYLHTVLSGWQTASPEIRSDVSATVELLTDISRSAPSVIRALAWPYCIAGCLANQEQESDFRDIVTSMGPLGSLGSIQAALEIMEKAWAKRDEIGDDLDMAGCLRSQGFKVLLI